jgi:hypothetical protein
MNGLHHPKKAPGWLLVIGSALASGFNFYSFLILPSVTGVASLEHFVRDNYLGGLYLFGIGSSVAPFSVFVLTKGRWPALARYIILASVTCVVIGVGGYRLARWPWSYLCLLAGACMHVAGFFLAVLMRQGRLRTAATLQVAQPALFAILVTLAHIKVVPAPNWALLYSSSCVCGLLLFVGTSDLHAVRELVRAPVTQVVGWQGIVTRVALSISFPLFFQLELILCGKLTDVNVGTYSMLQKLYSSIAISLFGGLGVLFLIRGGEDPTRRHAGIERKVVLMSVASSACVLCVGYVMALVGRAAAIPVSLIAGSALVAFVFTMASFITLAFNAFRPFVALRASGVSFAVYLAVFFAWRPNSPGALLIVAAVFFVTFVGLTFWAVPGLVESRETARARTETASGKILYSSDDISS